MIPERAANRDSRPGRPSFLPSGELLQLTPGEKDLPDCRAVTLSHSAIGRSRSTGRVGRVVGPEVARSRRTDALRPLRHWPCALAERQESVGPVEHGAASGESTDGWRVLVVDDEPSVRMICCFNLLAAGFDVCEAADGQEALAVIREAVVDLVLLDVMMPVLDGWEVARELQGDSRTRDLPIVFLTARAEPADRQRAADLGAVGYVLKPFDPIALPVTIERILGRLARGEGETLRHAVRACSDG